MRGRNRRNRAPVDPEDGPVRRRLRALPLLGARLGFIGIATLGLGVLLAEATRTLVALPALQLHHVQLTGGQRTTSASLLEVASVQLHDPLLRIPLAEAAQHMQAHPWVKSATVRRQLPDRLHIEVVEHEARALVMLGRLWLCNAAAETFKPFESTDRLALPVITGLSASEPEGPAAGASGARAGLGRVVPPIVAPAPSAAPRRRKLSLGGVPSEAELHADAQRRRLHARLEQALTLLRTLEGQALSVEELHFDEDLGWSAVLARIPDVPAAPGRARAPGRRQPVQVHLGREPQGRAAIAGATLARIARTGLVPEVVWLDHERDLRQVQVQKSRNL